MRIEELETPALVVDLDIMERNLQGMADYCLTHGLKLRPHTKTHKIPAIAHRQKELGAQGITVAKTGEAEVMAGAGLDDILIQYPVIDAGKLERLAALAHERTITLSIDSLVTASAISAAAHRAGSVIHLLIELDTGMRRCGVPTGEQAVTLGCQIMPLPGVRLMGITTYPGHIWAQPSEQAAALEVLSNQLAEAVDAFQQSGLPCDIVSAGSTPAARNSHLVRPLTEIRPGTYVFNDRNTAGVGACTLDDCALRVLATVVSTAVSGRAIIDGGSKTFTSDRWISGGTAGGHGYIVEQPEVYFAAMSEEHGHLDLGRSAYTPRVGDRLSVIPNHVCSCVNLHNTLYFHRRGEVEGSWQVAARGMVR